MDVLLLIPSVLKRNIEADVAQDRHPTMDYYALEQGLRAAGAGRVRLLDYQAVEQAQEPLVRLARQFLGRDAALALLGLLHRQGAEAIFTNGENVSLPLALLLRPLGRRRPGHVTIGHRLSTGKKRLFFRLLKLHREIDTIFVYARAQGDYGRRALGIPEEKLKLIPFHADTHFYRPRPDQKSLPRQICSAGLEWRDYPTLIEAVKPMADISVKLAAASPWSKHSNETKDRALPAHVEARRYEYGELRELYAQSAIVVVPLYENDFQAGVTTILEAMAMGKPVLFTKTTGQTDVIQEGETGIAIAPGDVEAWRTALQNLLEDTVLQERLGGNARRWIEENATLERWVANLVCAIRASVAPCAETPRVAAPSR